MRSSLIKTILFVGAVGLGLFLAATQAMALPSFARQTGLYCAVCHTIYPELTSYGRNFKLNGYTQTGTDELKSGSDDTGYRLAINNVPPIAAMLQISDVFVQSPPTKGTAVALGSDGNGTVEFPCQLSLFYAGKISPQMGAFAQFTYQSATGSFAIDNTDVRFATTAKVADTDLTLGLTANNNPTLQDVFNTAPAWSFPYASGKSAYIPQALTQLESLGAKVAGLGGYLFWNRLLYAEISAYRSAPQGFQSSAPPSFGAIQGLAPYWRVALTRDFDKHALELGATGMDVHTIPSGGVFSANQDHLTDLGVDAQYQYVSEQHSFTLKGSEIWENQVWDYSNAVPATPTTGSLRDKVQSFKVDATYYYNRMIGATVGYFSTVGSNDSVIYAANTALTPDTEGLIYELNFVPWYNTKFTFQYTNFSKYNGSTLNYNSASLRNAADNNSLMLMAWLMY